MEEKKKDLMRYLSSHAPLLISYSGGLDSSLLCFLADHATGKKPLCILLDSPLIPRDTIRRAKIRAEEPGYGCEVVRLPVLDDPVFRDNPKGRCAICKTISAEILQEIASRRGYSHIADGVHVSDLDEFRPGVEVFDREGILHPFVDCNISKDDIRAIARQCGLSFWNEPSGTCLATRIPYDHEITPEILGKIEAAEKVLEELECNVVRVRSSGNTAKIEVMPEDQLKIIMNRDIIIRRFGEIGFIHVLLDLRGYRSGSMDEIRRDADILDF